MTSIAFVNRQVEFDGPVDDDAFVFEIDKYKDVIPEDITKIYLDRLGAPAEAAPLKK